MGVKTIVVGDEAALLAALRAATGETLIRLKAGTYDNFIIDKINPTAKVTITSFDITRKTEIDTLLIKNSSNLTFQDLFFHHETTTDGMSPHQVRVRNSHDITFIRDEFAGNIDGRNTNDASGVMIEDSSRISILNNRFHDLTAASYVLRSDHVVVAGNDVRTVREGMNFSDADYVTIDRNLFTQFQPVLTGPRPDHPDGIQFWTTGSAGSSHVEITNNAFLFGNNVPIQGIFIRSEQGNAARHSDITIANNVYQGQSRHGITVYDADEVRITGNTVVSAPKAGTAQYLDPAINTKNTTDAQVDHNIAGLIFTDGDKKRIASDNVDAWDYRSGVGVKFADLFVKVPTGNSLPQDFLAKTKSVADILDAGYTRVDRTGNWSSITETLLDRYEAVLDNAGSSYHVV